eukprot:2064132-Rhodomonas_salina.2
MRCQSCQCFCPGQSKSTPAGPLVRGTSIDSHAKGTEKWWEVTAVRQNNGFRVSGVPARDEPSRVPRCAASWPC